MEEKAGILEAEAEVAEEDMAGAAEEGTVEAEVEDTTAVMTADLIAARIETAGPHPSKKGRKST